MLLDPVSPVTGKGCGMSLARELRERFAAAEDANLEFRRAGYRLALNPIKDRFEELGFILWQEEADGDLAPVATGRAVGDELVLDGETATGPELADLEAVVADLLAGEPIGPTGAGDNAPATDADA